jgi:hypothetical protein
MHPPDREPSYRTPASWPGSFQQRQDLGEYLVDDVRWSRLDALHLPGRPVEALQLVGEDDARDLAAPRQGDLEGIAFDL